MERGKRSQTLSGIYHTSSFHCCWPQKSSKSLSHLQQAGSVEKRPKGELGEAVCRTTAKATATLAWPSRALPPLAGWTGFCLGTGYRGSGPSSLAGRAAQICSRDFKCCHPAFNPCLTTSFFPGQKRFIRESFARGGAHDLRSHRRGPPTALLLPRMGLHQGVGVHQVRRPSLEPAD